MIGPALFALAFAIMAIGVWGLLVRRNVFRMIIGFSLLDTGVHIFMVAAGYREGGTAPIIDAQATAAQVSAIGVDPCLPRWFSRPS